MGGAVVGVFQVVARAEPYVSMALQPVGAPPNVRPEETFTYQMRIVNSGNRPQLFQGEVQAPEGWTILYPHQVVVDEKSTKVITFTGIAPARSNWMGSETSLFRVSYWPAGQEDSAQSRVFVAQLSGVYVHPAFVPLLLLGLLALLLAAFVIIYVRRAVEEQILGKPVPPWRIPVEREYLKRLEVEDPDEFFIVRYYLMVEEHRSALLWYKHFKHATRKDRKLERKWYKRTEKTKRSTTRLRAREGRLQARTARRLRVMPVRRRRRLARLDKKALDDQWSMQRVLLKEHRRAVKKIDKIHKGKAQATKKKAGKQHKKELKRAEKENRKRIREGEDPLPLPEEPQVEVPKPEFPDVVEVPIVGVEETRFAARYERLSARFNKKIARRSTKAKNKMRRKGAKAEKKASRLKKKIPKPPSTHMYDEDEYIEEGGVEIRDDRPYVQRLLNVPTLAQREELRRRRMVYRVKIRDAAHRGDEEEARRLKDALRSEEDRILAKAPRAARKKGTTEKRLKGPRPGSARQRSASGADDAAKQQTVAKAAGSRFTLFKRKGAGGEKGNGEDPAGATPASKEGTKEGKDPPG